MPHVNVTGWHIDVFLDDIGGRIRHWEHGGLIMSSLGSPNKYRISADLPTTTTSNCISLDEERDGFVASWFSLVE